MGLIFPGGPKRLHKQGDVQGLLAILRDTSQPGKDRRYAAFALGDIGSPDAVEDLIAVLFDFKVQVLRQRRSGPSATTEPSAPCCIYCGVQQSGRREVLRQGRCRTAPSRTPKRSTKPWKADCFDDGRLRALCRRDVTTTSQHGPTVRCAARPSPLEASIRPGAGPAMLTTRRGRGCPTSPDACDFGRFLG